jgi:hypothetical protein
VRGGGLSPVNIIRRWKRRALLVSEEEERPWGVSERNGMHLHSLAMMVVIGRNMRILLFLKYLYEGRIYGRWLR